jgi:hypothetical protein
MTSIHVEEEAQLRILTRIPGQDPSSRISDLAAVRLDLMEHLKGVWKNMSVG